jgi:uncharacterized protein (DUF1800 family)
MKRILAFAAITIWLASLSAAHAAAPDGDRQALHVLNRLGYGPRPGDIEKIRAIGVDRYIDQQLEPARIPLPEQLSQRLNALAAQEPPAGELLRAFAQAQKAAKQDPENGKDQRRELLQQVMERTAEARLVRAVYSTRQLEEVMVDFWFNHFNVFSGKGLDRVLIGSYERDAIRPYVLGNFRDLLGATARHPAMLFYLDNWMSAAPGMASAPFQGQKSKATGLNENYARELMELHTLGVDGGYSQKDVTELARILTGWTFNPRAMALGGEEFRFEEKRHDWGDKQWLGHQVAPRGQNEGEWALDVLAAHPATARHISYKLAQYFVSDRPPQVLVDRMARRFLDSRGDIRSVLRTLFHSREFRDAGSVGAKFKTPYQYVVSAARAADAPVVNVRPLLGTLNQLGMPLYGCQTPDGFKNTEEAWANADALTRRINFATALAAGRLPLEKRFDAGARQEMGKRQLERAALPVEPGRAATPVDADKLIETLRPAFSNRTLAEIEQAPAGLRAALLLGSPDFMRH